MSKEMKYGTALSAVSTAAGMFEGTGGDKLFEAWQHGGVELYARVLDYALFNDKVYEALNAVEPDGCAAVWEYEVSEEFGRWMAKRMLEDGAEPEEAEWKHELFDLGCQAFTIEKSSGAAVRAAANLGLAFLAKPTEEELTVKVLHTRMAQLEIKLNKLIEGLLQRGC